MIFASSNGRTYKIDFNQRYGWMEYDRFYIEIVKGDPIRIDHWDDGSGDNRCYSIAPRYDKVAGIIHWANPMYDDTKLIAAFVPDDLREYLDKVVKNLILL